MGPQAHCCPCTEAPGLRWEHGIPGGSEFQQLNVCHLVHLFTTIFGGLCAMWQSCGAVTRVLQLLRARAGLCMASQSSMTLAQNCSKTGQ